MKTRIIILAAMAAACASCANDYQSNPETVSETVKLRVDVGQPSTRLVMSASDTSDKTLNTVQVFVYNSANKLEASSGEQTSASNIVLSLVPGTKTVWAVVNAPAFNAPSTLDSLAAVRSNLIDNVHNNMIMTGSASINLLSDSNLSVTVSHIASKIIIEKITRSFSNPDYAEVPMVVKKIYMSNVAADCDLACSGSAPTDWICKQGEIDTPTVGGWLLIDSGMTDSLPENGSYNRRHVFYVYPNPTTTDSSSETWCPRKTRLVVECLYNGQTCYYPVTLPGSSTGAGTLDRNKVYHITNLTLTRPGSTNKDDKDPEISSNANFSFSINVAEWDTSVGSYTEQF
ncbi:MAG: hypothetical protein IK031_04830 [Bacteroidales bacterium]|nr:hypothetical protein [Bacteroidales bacterium]